MMMGFKSIGLTLVKIGMIAGLAFGPSSVWAQKTVRLSIATGGTGGSYYPMGGGMANIISKYIPYAEATAEVTSASIDNCLLVGKGKADLAFMNADTAWDAVQGKKGENPPSDTGGLVSQHDANRDHRGKDSKSPT
jgi:TRAP-type uncharacterized transport system substrate-binding protein